MMKVLRYTVVVVLVLFVPSFGFAVDIYGKEVELNLKAGWYSKYIGEGFGVDFFHNKGGVFQQSITATTDLWNFNVYIGGWSSYSSKGGFNEDFGDEIDYYAGVNRQMNNINIDLSYWYYHLFDLGKSNNDIHSLALNILLPKFCGITPYLYHQVNWPVSSGGPEKGYMYHLGFLYDLEMPKFFIGSQEKQILSLGLQIVGNDGVAGFEPGFITHSRFDISTEFKFGKIAIVPSLRFQIVSGDQDGDIGDICDGNKIWWGIQVKLIN